MNNFDDFVTAFLKSKKDESVFYVSTAPVMGIIAALFLVRGMETTRYQIYWFINTFVQVTLFLLTTFHLVRQSRVVHLSTKAKKDENDPNIDSVEDTKREKITEDMHESTENKNTNFNLESLKKKDRSSAETTFANENNHVTLSR